LKNFIVNSKFIGQKFLKMQKPKHDQRFSLLLLNDSEIYYEDYACSFFAKNALIKGRLHFCSFSLIFVPDDYRYSIKRYDFQSMVKEGIQVFYPSKKLSHLDYKEDSLFTIQIKQVIEMKKDNKNHSYIIEKDLKDQKFIFSLSFMTSKEFYGKISKVYKYWQSNESLDVISNILNTQFEAKGFFIFLKFLQKQWKLSLIQRGLKILEKKI
jgi:hypothetical protein